MKRTIIPYVMIASTTAFAQTQEKPSQKELWLMSEICENVKNIPVLEFPPPQGREAAYIDNFKMRKKRFEQDIQDLIKLHPDARSSEYPIKGKSFKETIEAGEKLIKENQAKLDAFMATVPSHEAQSIIEDAIMAGNTGTSLLKNYKGEPSKEELEKASALGLGTSPDYACIKTFYDAYTNNTEKAIKLDPKCATFYKKEIEFLDKSFATPFLEIKRTHEAVLAANEAVKAAEEKVAMARLNELCRSAEMNRLKEQSALNAEAESLGFPGGARRGIIELIDHLQAGTTLPKEAKQYLIHPHPCDYFKLQNVNAEYAFYSTGITSGKFIQIAIKRTHDGIYQEDSPLPGGPFKFLGYEEFTTVLGTTKQVATFAIVSKQSAKSDDDDKTITVTTTAAAVIALIIGLGLAANKAKNKSPKA